MPLDPDYVGKRYAPTCSYLVGREKMREFAAAFGDSNPAYRDEATANRLGYADLVAPPTFGFVLTMQVLDQAMADPDLGMDYSRVVHGEQSFVFSRPLVAGDEVLVDAFIEEIDSSGRNEFLTVRSDIHTDDGEVLVTARSVVVSRGTGADAGAFRPAQDKPAAPKVGEVVSRADFTVTRSHLIRYAGASGDFNPIHWNSRVATAVGLPDVIAHGMLTMALAGRAVTDWVGDPGRVEEYAVRFSRPVVVPDDDAGASLKVAVQRAESLADGKKARLTIAASCAGAQVLGNATAVVLLP